MFKLRWVHVVGLLVGMVAGAGWPQAHAQPPAAAPPGDCSHAGGSCSWSGDCCMNENLTCDSGKCTAH